MTEQWELLNTFKPFIKEAWEKENFTKPTSIQEQAIPTILEGKDVIAESPTGTGKTLAYLLPILQNIDVANSGVQAVILASSHELVMQINQEIQKWTMNEPINSASFIGGANVKRQLEKLKKRPQIIVGTPGRTYELIKMKKVKMNHVKMIVLDEADQLLVAEHIPTVQNIVKSALADRQIVVFSATLKEETEKVATSLLQNPEKIRIEKEDALPPVEHIYFECEARDKIEFVRKLGRLDKMRGIAFMKDIGNLSVFAEKLAYKGLPIAVIHGDTKKQDRAKAIQEFRSGKKPLLLATDVAARGLDIEGVTHVIHIDVPEEVNQYVHRSGRTGRLGSSFGTIISLVTSREERTIKQLARKLGIDVQKKVLIKGQIRDVRRQNG
ncbi:superfamily II DNA/RNA helicase [Salirhabdus euzebyi]|uniref:Superfamily II DNA/RNA helicase n=1 Tax=Salirhabdus euzebyi TaxID=394506 RepID=A0A841PU38_9BACI|nr:DEAD/DEAH box helicase [Salirhabdus euzebyi]MBB6452359.1 superfamily II DNA/RNA helicase [Salirhabdus euzebyi]